MPRLNGVIPAGVHRLEAGSSGGSVTQVNALIPNGGWAGRLRRNALLSRALMGEIPDEAPLYSSLP
jgi:hypothetical protein